MSDKNTERAMIMMNMTAMLQLTIEKAMSAAELSLEDAESCKKWYAGVIEMGNRMSALISECSAKAQQGISDEQ